MPLLSNYSSRPGIIGGAAGPLGDDGKLPSDQLPATGITARVTVANQAARYALTIADVQNGDYVRQTDTGILYEVTDETQLAPGVTPANAFTGLATVTAAQISDSGAVGRAVVQSSTSANARTALELTAAATGDASGLTSGLLPTARLPAATDSVIGAVMLATPADVVTGTGSTKAVTSAGVRAGLAAYADPIAATRAPLKGVFYGDAATANRRIEWTMGTAGNVAGSALSEVGHIFRVPTTNPVGTSCIVFALSSNPSTDPDTLPWAIRLAIGTTGNLSLRCIGATTADLRTLLWTGFRSAYSGRVVRLDVVMVSGSSSPVVYLDGVDVTANFASTTSGTPTDWMSASLVANYRVCDHNWPAAEFIPGTPINRTLTAAEVSQMVQTGALLPQDRLGGSVVASYSSDFSAGVNSWVQNIGNAALLLTGNIDAISAVNDVLQVANTSGSSLSFQVARSSSLVAGAYYQVSADVYVDAGAITGSGYLGLGFSGARQDTGSTVLAEGAWQTVTLVSGVGSLSSATLTLFSTATGSSTRQINAAKSVYFKNITYKALGALLQPQNTGTARVMDVGPNRIHGLVTAGIRPFHDAPLAPIEFTVTSAGAFLTSASTNPLVYGTTLIDRITAVGDTSAQTLTLRNNSFSGNDIITAATAITTASVPQDLTLIGAQRTLAALSTIWGSCSVGTVRLLIWPRRA